MQNIFALAYKIDVLSSPTVAEMHTVYQCTYSEMRGCYVNKNCYNYSSSKYLSYQIQTKVALCYN